MTTIPNSPRLLKVAIVGEDSFNPLATMIIFQYDPDTFNRTLQAQAMGSEGTLQASLVDFKQGEIR